MFVSLFIQLILSFISFPLAAIFLCKIALFSTVFLSQLKLGNHNSFILYQNLTLSAFKLYLGVLIIDFIVSYSFHNLLIIFF